MNEMILERPINLKTWHIYFLIMVATWANMWIMQNYVMTREVYYNLLSDQLEMSRIDDYFYLVRKMSFFAYLLSPLILWIQLVFVTLLIQFPLVLKFMEIPFKSIFRIVTLAQIPLLIMTFVRTIWLLHYQSFQITNQALMFTPLSITNFLNISAYPKSSFQILSNFNLFQILWCGILIKGLIATGKLKKIDAVMFVLWLWIFIILFQWAIVLYFTKINS